ADDGAGLIRKCRPVLTGLLAPALWRVVGFERRMITSDVAITGDRCRRRRESSFGTICGSLDIDVVHVAHVVIPWAASVLPARPPAVSALLAAVRSERLFCETGAHEHG